MKYLLKERKGKINIVNILFCSSDVADIRSFWIKTYKENILNPVKVVGDSYDALDFLTNSGKYSEQNYTLPSLIILNDTYEDFDAVKVLTELRSHKIFQEIPILIAAKEEHLERFKDTYTDKLTQVIAKPIEMKDFYDCLERFKPDWSFVVKTVERKDRYNKGAMENFIKLKEVLTPTVVQVSR